MAIYAIGDVQGCFRALRKLVKRIKFDPTTDRLWFVGDLVNRGPDSLEVLRYIKDLGSAAVTVLGNHDIHLLAVWAGVARLHRKDTVGPVLSAPDCDELLTWLRHRPLVYREHDYVMLHAGLLPQWTIAQAEKLAREVEEALRGEAFVDMLPFIYFRGSQASWSTDLGHQDRLSLATNVMTRIRVCTPEGEPDFSFKGRPNDAPQGLVPWFAVPGRATARDTIIFGHWSALGLFVKKTLIGLDAGCVWGQELIALRLDDRKVFRASCSG
ncbi:MAG: symmetrical bis(5'-nucleosyl)-tetraphosphatase [Nitrospirales bacterium]|nr:symmetrical bis(5'-nucleosyl)-tetraphosphatase [Nitrospira sp.]MDR4501080.1 symmetrical bis(5'-nucleosyl)-tetraphosphatase [Nitrospirales bacterium]